MDHPSQLSLLGQVKGAESVFLRGRRNREADLKSAVKYFLEFLKASKSINRAIKNSSKPHLALRIIEEISARRKESIPPRLSNMITSCLEQAHQFYSVLVNLFCIPDTK